MRLDDLSSAEKRWRRVVLFRDHRPARRGIGWLLIVALVCASLLSLAFASLDIELDRVSRADPARVLSGSCGSAGVVAPSRKRVYS